MLVLLLLLLPLTTHAQSAAGWEVAVFADGTQAITVLTAEGVSHTIPAGVTLNAGSFPSDPLAAISLDRRALAALDFTPYGRLNVRIASGGTCCTTTRVAAEGTVIAQMGSFSPNGRRFAVSYLTVADEAARQFDSAIVVIDVEFGFVTATLERAQIGGDFAWLRGWSDDGISFVPICYGCDQPPSGSLSRWNPETGGVERDLGFESLTQATLSLTGESVAVARRPDYPLPAQGDSPNVVTYGGRVIYYNPRSLVVDAVHWVADGWQLLIEHPDAQVLVDRSGVQRPVPSNDAFLVGTPDGWLSTRALEGDAVAVVHHTLTNLEGAIIARFYHAVHVIQAAPLGATASLGGFPGVPSPVSRITCSNALPPRLIAGGRGRVIGGGVNLRREPSVTASSIVMITTETFNVIAGPNCDPTGIAWWQVGIGGLRGWMAESKDGAYLLEPVLN